VTPPPPSPVDFGAAFGSPRGPRPRADSESVASSGSRGHTRRAPDFGASPGLKRRRVALEGHPSPLHLLASSAPAPAAPRRAPVVALPPAMPRDALPPRIFPLVLGPDLRLPAMPRGARVPRLFLARSTRPAREPVNTSLLGPARTTGRATPRRSSRSSARPTSSSRPSTRSAPSGSPRPPSRRSPPPRRLVAVAEPRPQFARPGTKPPKRNDASPKYTYRRRDHGSGPAAGGVRAAARRDPGRDGARPPAALNEIISSVLSAGEQL
jgi:hypothetical protein